MNDTAHTEPIKCGAKTSSTGGTCNKWPIKGGTRCFKHGGASPRAKAAAEKNLLVIAASRLVGRPVTDPLRELQHNAGLMTAFRDFLQQQVDDLEKYTYWAITAEDDDHPPMAIEKVRALVPLYTQALRDVHKACADMAKLAIDQQLLAIDQQRVDLIRRVIDGVFDDLELTGARRGEAEAAFARRIRELPQAS